MRIGIVNDMPLAREALRRVVTSATAAHSVAWLAADGAQAVAEAARELPDVILMDLIMPGMDGVEATRRIMAETPCPILIVTSVAQSNFQKVFEAMSHGALDAVDTPKLGPGGELNGASNLLAKIAMVSKLVGKPGLSLLPSPTTRPPSRAGAGAGPAFVAIGASTGGPNAVAALLSAFPKRWDATVAVVLHMDVAFAPGLARWLSDQSGHQVTTAEPGSQPEPGKVVIAATNDHLVLNAERRFLYSEEPRSLSFRPSADVFFSSLAAHWNGPGVAALLTGMGRDGASGLLALRRAGWFTIAQDEATSIVWGMPRAAVEVGAAIKVLPLPEIGPAVVDAINKLSRIDRDTRS
jgi:two-component system response regulator WspF